MVITRAGRGRILEKAASPTVRRRETRYRINASQIVQCILCLPCMTTDHGDRRTEGKNELGYLSFSYAADGN